MVTVTKEMIRAYIEGHCPLVSEDEMDCIVGWVSAGATIVAHLESPNSEQWRREHGFLEQD